MIIKATAIGLKNRKTDEAKEIDRQLRAEFVGATYIIEEQEPGLYRVQHPYDADREYFVNTQTVSCDCADFLCRGISEGFRCKHMLAVMSKPEPTTNYASWFTPAMEPDADDPYKD